MTESTHLVREITGCDDPAWEGWKGIYLASFPANERMSMAFFHGVMERHARQEALDEHLLVMQATTGDVDGLACYQFFREADVGFLWYLATDGTRRSRGLGAALYGEVARRLRADGARLLVFEVEIPELAETPEAREWARRRLGWYRQQGARVIAGARHFSKVDGEWPPLEMLLMAHPFVPMDAEAAFDRAKTVLGDDTTQVGPLRFE